MVKTFLFITSTLVIFFVMGCNKDIEQSDTALISAAQAGGGTHSVTTAEFAAVANVVSCTGYNIRFSGIVEFKTNYVRNSNGTLIHYTRNWSIKGLTATSWTTTNAGSGTSTVNGQVTTYEVVAGHEMFAVKGTPVLNTAGMPVLTLPTPPNASGTINPNIDVFIHQGTIVLQNVNDPRDRLVLRHEMVKTPNDDNTMDMNRMGWYINGQICGM